MSQWSTYGKPDPLVPFELGVLTELQAVLQAGADDSREVIGRLKHLADNRNGVVWVGDAAEAFFADIADLPLNLKKLVSSYDEASSAVGAYIVDLTRIRRMADMRLDVINAYESKIASLELDLAGVPPDDQEYRTELEWEASTNRIHRDDMVREADVVLRELEDAVDQFVRAMRNAQDLGIHNRLGFVRFYQDKLDMVVDSITGGLDTLRSYLTVVGLACMVLPIPGARIVGGVLIASSMVMGVASVTLKGFDILLSDDDADAAYFLDAGMTTFGLGTSYGKVVTGSVVGGVASNTLNAWSHGLSMVQYGGVYSAVSQFHKVVTVVDNTVKAIDFTIATLEIHPRDLEVTPGSSSRSQEIGEPGSTGTDILRSGISIGFQDPIWTIDRLMMSPYVTTPTVVDLEVDVLSGVSED